MRSPRVPDPWFLELWASAASVPEAARLTGYALVTTQRRARKLRQRGEQLRRLPTRDEDTPIYDLVRQGG